jgi:exonuclease III
MKTYLIEYSETLTYREYIKAENEDEANDLFFGDFNYLPKESDSNDLKITKVQEKLKKSV